MRLLERHAKLREPPGIEKVARPVSQWGVAHPSTIREALALVPQHVLGAWAEPAEGP